MTNSSKKDRRLWRNGYTTGSCAAGAAKVACAILKGKPLESLVEIPLPNSGRLKVPIYSQEGKFPIAKASVLKDGGDDPDVTHGIEIRAVARYLSEKGDIYLKGGRGVGTVTKKGLPVPVGESAINPIPRHMIIEAVREIFPQEEIEIVIEVPEGEKIAERTLNPRLGIVGGISILGTTGIVRPMSEEAFKNSILPELDQAVAYGHRTIVLTPGNYGFKLATERMGVSVEAVVQMSNFVGFILEEATYRQIEQVLLLGHIGKLIKVAGGIFHTHSKIADARIEILLAQGLLYGLSADKLKRLAEFPTIEGAASELLAMGEQDFLNHLAHLVSAKAQSYVHGQLLVGTVLTQLDGSFIGWDAEAERIINSKRWSLK